MNGCEKVVLKGVYGRVYRYFNYGIAGVFSNCLCFSVEGEGKAWCRTRRDNLSTAVEAGRAGRVAVIYTTTSAFWGVAVTMATGGVFGFRGRVVAHTPFI